jgi:MYXO-CTERM domain-containing protein
MVHGTLAHNRHSASTRLERHGACENGLVPLGVNEFNVEQEHDMRKMIWSLILALGLTLSAGASTSYAQDTAGTGMQSGTGMQTETNQEDDGTDWGWLGLLGLAGLLGLRRRDRTEHHDRVDTTTRTRV